ncbi:MAG TPA: hypothetical protein VEU06_08000 [Micropepsaceae bacterium]|nr:hypothetical protein [Micropepsaceae bacterium]
MRGHWLIGALLFAAMAPAGHSATPIPDFSANFVAWNSNATDFIPPPTGPRPVTFDKTHPYVPNGVGGQPTFRIADPSNPILKPWAIEKMRQANAEVLSGKAAFTAKSACWPGGVPGVLLRRFEPVYFIQTPKEVWIVWQFDHQVRRVYMDRPHSARVTPSWYGESVGRYEGDALVVDTIGLSDKSYVDNYRTPHTAKLHVVERFHVIDGGKTLEASVTVDDPDTFNMSWSGIQHWRRVEPGPLSEEICAENNTSYFSHDVAPIPVAVRPDF